MSPSKRVREEAALICAIAASTPDSAMAHAMNAIGASERAFRLALDAQGAAWTADYECANGADLYALTCAEAASMLLDGWTPGDEP